MEPAGGPIDSLTKLVRGRGTMLGIGAALMVAIGGVSVGVLPSQFGSDATKPPVETTAQSLFTRVPLADTDKAIALLALADADKDSIRREVQRGSLRLALITVLDNDAEDGDWISIIAAGYRQDVRLFHKHYTVAVPYLPGSTIAVTGLKDGGGGDITVTVLVGGAKLALKPLKERETIQLTPP